MTHGRTLLAVGAMLLLSAACGESSDDEACFDDGCYRLCLALSEEGCTADEVCVYRTTGDGAGVRVCAKAYDFAGCTEASDCAELVVGACEVVGCDVDAGVCTVTPAADGTACQTSLDTPGICGAGACACTPDCADRECGDDGCAGVCGVCPQTSVCTSEGACVPVR
jgi:hypothetical protein